MRFAVVAAWAFLGATGCVADVSDVEAPEVDLQEVEAAFVNCKNLSPADCMRKCLRRAIPCQAHRTHPYAPSSGIGNLFTCGEIPHLICAYRYRNKDQCYFFPGSTTAPKCMYEGG